MKKIILINGKKGHGKDFLALQIQKVLADNGYTSDIMSFADPIKDILCTTLNIDLDFFNDMKNEKSQIYVDHKDEKINLVNGREVIQNFGTEAMKKWFGENVWSKLTNKFAEESTADYIIIPDFRFKTEIISTISVHIENKNLIDEDTHRSETELDGASFMFYIDNTGKPDLTDVVEELTRSIISL